MATHDLPIHICDDWISIKLPDWEFVIAAQDILSADDRWTEIVPGLESLAVHFDPAIFSPDSVADRLADQLTNLTVADSGSRSTITIPVCYDSEFAPDLEFIAERLDMDPKFLPSWHIAQMHRVAMLGFMPGFAYLENTEDTPSIGRLDSPRQLVAAGSIGIIGRQSCIYSFDSPGGWPIIGRTPLCLFDVARRQPNLLSTGQNIRFEDISRAAFDQWPPGSAE